MNEGRTSLPECDDLYRAVWCCMVLYGVVCCCLVLYGVWCCLGLHSSVLYRVVLGGSNLLSVEQCSVIWYFFSSKSMGFVIKSEINGRRFKSCQGQKFH